MAGHGMLSVANPDRYYFLTTDFAEADLAKIESPTPLPVDASAAISSDDLYGWLSQERMPLRQVVVMDTCAAGGAASRLARLASRREVPASQKRAMELLKDNTGTFILMGAGADNSSYESSEYGEGLLTYALLDGMRSRETVDVGAWFQQASLRVPELARRIGQSQQPIVAAPRGTSFPVGRFTCMERAAIPMPEPKPSLARPEAMTADGLDPLGLDRLLRQEIIARTDPQLRSPADGKVKLVYLDDAEQDTPGILVPRLVYTVSGSTATGTLRLVDERTHKVIRTQRVSGSTTDPQQLAQAIAQRMEALALDARGSSTGQPATPVASDCPVQ